MAPIVLHGTTADRVVSDASRETARARGLRLSLCETPHAGARGIEHGVAKRAPARGVFSLRSDANREGVATHRRTRLGGKRKATIGCRTPCKAETRAIEGGAQS